MTLSARGIASVLVLAVISDAFRTRTRSGSASTQDFAEGRASGYVNKLYTWGAPSVYDDGSEGGRQNLQDPRTGGCWQGQRIITINSGGWTGTWDVDVVSQVANAVGYKHAKQPTAWLSNESNVIFNEACGVDRETWGWSSVSLHSQNVYAARADLLSGEASTFTKYFLKASYYQATDAANYISPSGYKLVGSSEWDDKETHLMQHPSSKNCVLAFQGTTSERILDWWDNIRFYDVTFCGLGDTVHGGFVDQLRTILDTQSFKTNIHNKLPKCNELTVVGHSLGGALAALYSYCLNAGSSGGADNNRVRFSRSTPAVLPPLY